MRKLSFVVSLLVVTVASAQTCDRACLNRVVDSYLAALVAHDPTRVTFAKDAKLTENAKVIRAGEGLWESMGEGPTKFKLYVPDPVAEQVGFLGVIKESGFHRPPVQGQAPSFVKVESGIYPVLLALRLKVQRGQIVESEVLLSKSSVIPPLCNSPNVPDQFKSTCQFQTRNLPSLETVRPGLLSALSSTERTRREEMLRIADSYYDSVVRGKGSAAPFADDCVRRENGLQTTLDSPEQAQTAVGLIGGGISSIAKIFALGCAAQADTGFGNYITSIDRRVQIADPESGLVFAESMFHRRLPDGPLRITGVPGLETLVLEGVMQPSERVWAHVFKVSGRKLHEIEAMGGIDLPVNSKSGWEETR